MKHKMVVVTWLDAHAGGEWVVKADIAKMKPETTKSVGLLVRSDAEVVVIAQTENSEHIGDCLVIPRGMVRRVQVLK